MPFSLLEKDKLATLNCGKSGGGVDVLIKKNSPSKNVRRQVKRNPSAKWHINRNA